MKVNRKLWRIFVSVVLALTVLGIMAGCRKKGAQILLDQESYTVEYGETFIVPYATCTTGEEVIVTAYDADGYEVPVEYGTCYFEKGENKLVFTAGNLTKEVIVLCQDTTPPQVLMQYSTSAAVGHWYTLPTPTAEDISGVDTAKMKVELYKEGDSTPVLTVPGDRIRVENVGSYTLKVSATDFDGNEALIEKTIKVLNRPESEVIQDFAEEVFGYHEDTWGGGAPILQWYEEIDGRNGVLALGCVDGDDYKYLWWTDLGMDHIDLVGCTGFTFKLKANRDVCRQVSIKPGFSAEGINVTPSWSDDDKWCEVTISLVNTEISDLSDFTVGLAIATLGEGECVWIDEIIAHYTPYPEYTVTVENGTVDYPYDTIPEGRIVTVKHDDALTPAGKAFMYYEADGERIWGGTFTVTKDMELKAVYTDLVTEEKTIPEGAVMVTDFSTVGLVVNDEIWGNGNVGISEWYRTYQGVAGVRSVGALKNNEYVYTQWNGILPQYFDYESYTHITFRMKIDTDKLRGIGLRGGEGDTDLLKFTNADMDWTDVKVPLNRIDAFWFYVANESGVSGEFAWIDQIYVTKEPNYSGYETKIPAGAKMVQNFSQHIGPANDSWWGTGRVGLSNWYAKYDGLYGVQSFGFDYTKEISYTQWMEIAPDNLKGYTHITFRMKADTDKLRMLSFRSENNGDIDLLPYISESMQWTYITVKLNKVPVPLQLAISNVEGAYGEMVWIDQIYLSNEPDMSKYELALPEGAVMVEDFSEKIGPKNDSVWGTGTVGITNWYQKLDDVYGVQAFGFKDIGDIGYTQWYGVLPDDFDYSKYTHIHFRMKADKEHLRMIALRSNDGDVNLFSLVEQSNEWIVVKVKLADVPGFMLALSNTAEASGELIWIDQVYVTKEEDMSQYEQPIPEGALMLQDFSERVLVENDSVWGGGAIGISNHYREIDGVYGVQSFGFRECTGETYTRWRNVLPSDVNFSGYTHINFRLKLNKESLRSAAWGNENSDIGILNYVTESNEWTVVTLKITDVPGFILSLANVANVSGEMIWLDQIYLTTEEAEEPAVPELELPEGATLICDYSETITPHIPDTWGTGAAGAYYNSYAEHDGRAGVFAMGANGECFMWYNAVGLNEMDLTSATTITFRMKVDSRIRNLQIKHDDIEELDLLQHVAVRDEWTTVTLNVADLGYSDLSKATIQFRFATWDNGNCEYVWLDQVYVDGEAVEEPEPSEPTEPSEPSEPTEPVLPGEGELELSEGATLICDYSKAITPHIPDNWGHGPAGAYYNNHTEKDGRAGVFGMGANGECFMWYNDIGLTNLNLTNAETITFRIKVDSRIRNLQIKHDGIEEFDLLQYVSVMDQWTEATVNVADLGFTDLSKATIQFRFATWNNGEVEYVLLDQVYINGQTEEDNDDPVRLLCDYSDPITPHIPNTWGSGEAAGYYNSYETFEGRTGVFGMGAKAGTNYMWYNAIGLNDMDLSGMDKITFRIMVKDGVRSLQIKHDDTDGIDILQDVTAFDQWIELTYNVADLGFSNLGKASIQFRFATPVDAGESEWIWLDEVFATKEIEEPENPEDTEITELAIPEGATLVTDFSTAAAPFNNPYFGSGAVGMTQWYEKFDGVAGVQAFGITDSTASKGTLWSKVFPTDFDFSSYTTITLRFKLNKTATTAVAVGSASKKYDFYALVETDNGWTTVTLNLADLPGFYLILSNAAGASGEMIWLDQIYVQ